MTSQIPLLPPGYLATPFQRTWSWIAAGGIRWRLRRTREEASRLCCWVLASLLAVAASAHAQVPDRYQPAQMQSDLERFRTALIQIHPGLYTHQSPEEFDRFVTDLKREASRPLPPIAFYRIVLRLIASLHDGHTQAYATGDLGKAIGAFRRLPFRVLVSHERIFIVEDLGSRGIPKGSELLALDGRLSHEILRGIFDHHTSDGVGRAGISHWLGGPYKPFGRIYPELYGDRPTYEVSYRNALTREVVSTAVKALSGEVYDERIKKASSPDSADEEVFSCVLKGKESIAFLRIRRFFQKGYDEPEEIYPDFYEICFQRIREQKIRNLIIDLRDNGGGKASNAAHLLRYFIDEPLKPARVISTLGDDEFFLKATGKSLDLESAFGLEPMANGRFSVTRTDVLGDLRTYDPMEQYDFKGKPIVLINGGTASAAAIAAGLLQHYADAILVGEETFGYAGISNGVRQVSIRGDHTETAIYLPLLHAEYSIPEPVRRRGVVPDHPVATTVRDVLDGHDSAMSFVSRELLSSKR